MKVPSLLHFVKSVNKRKAVSIVNRQECVRVLCIEYRHPQMLKFNLVGVVGLFAIELLMFLFVMSFDEEN